MPFLPLALVTSAVADLILIVFALWMCAVQGLFWLAGYGQGTIHGLRGVCFLLAPPPNPAVKRDAALVRVAPYF